MAGPISKGTAQARPLTRKGRLPELERTRAVMRSKDTTTAKTLRKLAERGDVTKAQESAWTSMRNQVMHGKLVLPWSDMKQDEKIQELAGLFHSLTRAVAREG